MSKMKFFTDEHLSKRIIDEIRKHDITIVRCEDVGLKEAADEELLTYAADNAYTLISMDDDVTRLHDEWIETGRTHYGIVYAPMSKYQGAKGISRIVTWCVEMAELIEEGAGTIEDDIKNSITFL